VSARSTAIAIVEFFAKAQISDMASSASKVSKNVVRKQPERVRSPLTGHYVYMPVRARGATVTVEQVRGAVKALREAQL
jgi:hypothetical protein